MSDFVTDTFCTDHGPHGHGLCPYCIERDARVAAEQIASDERIGGLCYKGNSVSWTYSKAQNYGKSLDKVWEALREIGVPCDGNTHAADAIRRFCVRRSREAGGWEVRVYLPAVVVAIVLVTHVGPDDVVTGLVASKMLIAAFFSYYGVLLGGCICGKLEKKPK